MARPNKQKAWNWKLFEQRWRDKCETPCVGNWSHCSCRQWAVTRSKYPYRGKPQKESNTWNGLDS